LQVTSKSRSSISRTVTWLYQNKSLREEADYAERAEATAEAGDWKLVQKIIEGTAAIGESTAWGVSLGCLSSLHRWPPSLFRVSIGRDDCAFYQYQDDMRQEVPFASQRTNDQF